MQSLMPFIRILEQINKITIDFAVFKTLLSVLLIIDKYLYNNKFENRKKYFFVPSITQSSIIVKEINLEVKHSIKLILR